jgi:hypothetical protein
LPLVKSLLVILTIYAGVMRGSYITPNLLFQYFKAFLNCSGRLLPASIGQDSRICGGNVATQLFSPDNYYLRKTLYPK